MSAAERSALDAEMLFSARLDRESLQTEGEWSVGFRAGYRAALKAVRMRVERAS